MTKIFVCGVCGCVGVKYGFQKGVQRYKCKKCGKIFTGKNFITQKEFRVNEKKKRFEAYKANNPVYKKQDEVKEKSLFQQLLDLEGLHS